MRALRLVKLLLFLTLTLSLTFAGPAFSSNIENQQDRKRETPNLSTLLSSNPKNQSGQFKQRRFLSAFNQPLVSEGTFKFTKNESLNWNIDIPFSVQYLYDGKTLTQTEFGESNKIGLKDDPMLVGFFSFFYDLIHGDTQEIERLFTGTITPFQSGNYEITLTPKKSFLEKSFRNVLINIDDMNISRVQIFENDLDRIELEFSFNAP